MTLLTKHIRVYAKWTIVLSAACLLCAAHIPKTRPKGVKTIVIDPGHGGKDPGCNGDISNEKDVSLAIALKLGGLIEKNLKDVKVIYTRKTDIFVELEERAQIANRNEADLFISIHCNAASVYATYKDKKGKIHYKTYKDKKGRIRKVEVHNPKPYGSATYVMGISNEKGKLNTAKRENAAMLLEENYKKTYDGFDPESDEAYIVMSLWTGAFVEQSASLASKIQEEYVSKSGRIDKGVQRQSIWVLWRTAMPSILTEVGFLTNPEEEKFLNSEKGQNYMASSLFRATRRYKDETEGHVKRYDDDLEKQEPLLNENLTKGNKNEENTDLVIDSAKVNEAAIEEKYNTTLKAAEDSFKLKNYEGAGRLYALCNELRPEEKYPLARVGECKKRSADAKKNQSEEEKKKKEDEVKYNDLIAGGDKMFSQGKWSAAIIQYQLASDIKHDEKYPRQKIKEAEEKKKSEVAQKDTVVTPKNIIDNYKDNTPKTTKDEIAFKVQFGVSEMIPDFKSEKYKDLEDPSYYKVGNMYKITAGNFPKPDDAINLQNKMRVTGYKDCFVVAFKNGKRVEYKEAVRLLSTP